MIEPPKSKSISIPSILLCLGISLILIAFNERLKSTNTENLREVVAILQSTPYLITGSKRIDRYEISTTNYGCEFWIMDTELTVLRNNPKATSILSDLRSGDSLSLKIDSRDANFLHDSHKTLKCRGVTIGSNILVDPYQSNKGVYRTFYWILTIGIIFVTLGLITKITKKVKE